jgi:hypothetical protein
VTAAKQVGIDPSRLGGSLRRSRTWRSESAAAVVAVVAAGAAFWVTFNATFLEYPYWLAVQKADFILGPVFVGLYWHHRRSGNRLGLMLIALGMLGIPYILESASSPWPFTLGTLSEYAIFPMTIAVILAFPNGRLDGIAPRAIVGVALVVIPVAGLVLVLMAPQFTPSFRSRAAEHCAQLTHSQSCPRRLGATVLPTPPGLR